MHWGRGLRRQLPGPHAQLDFPVAEIATAQKQCLWGSGEKQPARSSH